MVKNKRHVAKTITYRLLSTTIGFTFMFIFTGSIEVSAAFSTVELLWKPIQYYLHERIWYKYIRFGIK